MKELTLHDLREICHHLQPKEITLHSDNQAFQFGELGIRFDLRFNDIDFCLNPDIIYLTEGKSCLQINKIKKIYKCKSSVFAHKYKIVCTGFYDENKETTHTLVF